jgi:hypothetical protein
LFLPRHPAASIAAGVPKHRRSMANIDLDLARLEPNVGGLAILVGAAAAMFVLLLLMLRLMLMLMMVVVMSNCGGGRAGRITLLCIVSTRIGIRRSPTTIIVELQHRSIGCGIRQSARIAPTSLASLLVRVAPSRRAGSKTSFFALALMLMLMLMLILMLMLMLMRMRKLMMLMLMMLMLLMMMGVIIGVPMPRSVFHAGAHKLAMPRSDPLDVQQIVV